MWYDRELLKSDITFTISTIMEINDLEMIDSRSLSC